MREKKSDKNQSELLAAAEAILFTMGKSVELSKMAEALGLSEAQTKALIEKLKEKYEDECCGLQIVELLAGKEKPCQQFFSDIPCKFSLTA